MHNKSITEPTLHQSVDPLTVINIIHLHLRTQTVRVRRPDSVVPLNSLSIIHDRLQKNKKLSCCRYSSRYDAISDSGRSANANRNPGYDLYIFYFTGDTVSTITASRQHLRSAAGHQLVMPSHRLTTYGRRAFSVAGPMFWNSLPRNLRDPSHTAAVFGRSLKTFLFSEY